MLHPYPLIPSPIQDLYRYISVSHFAHPCIFASQSSIINPPPFPPQTINPHHRRIGPAVHLPYMSHASHCPLLRLNLCIYHVLRCRCVTLISLLLSPSRAHPSKFCLKFRPGIQSHSPIITSSCILLHSSSPLSFLVRPPPSGISTCSCHCQAWTMSLGSTYSRTFVLVHSSRHSRIDLGSIQCNKYANVIEFNILRVFWSLCELLPSLALPMDH